jgi:hypothetical protein
VVVAGVDRRSVYASIFVIKWWVAHRDGDVTDSAAAGVFEYLI